MKIPFVDLKGQYQSIRAEIDKAISAVITDTAFIGGKYVTEFEEKFASLYGVRHVISCGNGTDSIYIILKMLGIGAGDEVITVANSWISSSEAITQTGARPVFVDIDPDFYSIDESAIESKITPRTKAIMPVHLQGQVCAMDVIESICKKNSLLLIEDCAQAHFSEFSGKRVGLFGAAGSFSFYPGKNLGAYGDAGCIITNDDQLAAKMRMYARHGALKKHEHIIEGINSRMDGMQAAILSAKLPYIYEWTDRRITVASEYMKLLEGIPQIVIPKVRQSTKHTFHLFVVRAKSRDELAAYLASRGVETFIHYPRTLPNLPAYAYLNHTPQDFPVASRLQGEILSLPIFPELTTEMVAFIAESVREFYRTH